MKLSMYWISRARITELITSLLSFITTASDNSKIEYIVAIDDDDKETIEGLEKIKHILKKLYNVDLKVIVSKRHGYHSIHMYHNLVAKEFTGDCMCTFNDDMFCVSKDWDVSIRSSIESHMDEPLLIFKKGIDEEHKWWPTAHGINRKWLDIASNNFKNYAFMHPGMDVWLQRFATEFNLKVIEPKYDIMHIQKKELRFENPFSVQNRTPEQQKFYEIFSQYHMKLVKENFAKWISR